MDRRRNFILQKLDRCLANADWVNLFPNHHKALVLNTNFDNSMEKGIINQRSRFHFEEVWADEQECGDIIEKEWTSRECCNSDWDFKSKTQKCGNKLQSWNTMKRKELYARVKESKKKVEDLTKNINAENWGTLKVEERDLNAIMGKHERYWRQRSRAVWMKSGDKNSKKIHLKASARKKKNKISEILNCHGI
ncbi:hypothetical protein F8388_011175 [Cannabis sativa]|uniref:Uncharacterized protein n=1 Tax=Cannabis sativa TaxID=3483 RepID=A0A7J6EG73_CANSA|nr:hypothetical protein F8388_011175 [Cannabis sativa]